ncbi:ABC transporter permease, partial [Acidisphaera sp. L21]|uniref:ABC transporter permease n=1 Tax=Acidisphaera sp. L21 TaxID=1641851 RepID=UPI00300451DF
MVQVRVINALMMRELHTRFGRENIGFLWVIGEPFIFCAGVSVAWTAMRPAHEHGLPMTAIVITGYVPLTMWRHCIGRAVRAFDANGSLMFHRHVTPLDIITSRSLLEIGGTIFAGLVVAVGAYIVGYLDPPKNIGDIVVGLLYQSVFSYACALIIAALSEQSEILEKLLGLVSYLSIPFSGAFTMVNWVPPSFQSVLLWSPSVSNVELIREGQFGMV